MLELDFGSHAKVDLGHAWQKVPSGVHHGIGSTKLSNKESRNILTLREPAQPV